ncbi:MAG TPA: DUF3368 domain-containing protein, partial [Isosphaeraceae bacterium]
VVSDTSPLRALANLGLLGLLHDLYSEVIVPPSVEKELANAPRGQSPVNLDEHPFLQVRSASDKAVVAAFLEDLDLGESEALALALEIRADLILIDETAGRDRAKQVGLSAIGVLGVLLEAKRSSFIGDLLPLLDQLQDEYRFYLTPQVRAEVLRRAGETP